jgi:hypothetical protein
MIFGMVARVADNLERPAQWGKDFSAAETIGAFHSPNCSVTDF